MNAVVTPAGKRIGRPMKAPRPRKRASLSLMVEPELKKLVDKFATENGVTQSAAAGAMIRQAVVVRQVLEATSLTLTDFEKTSFEMELRRNGYIPIRHIAPDGRVWKLWAEPGFPGLEASGFKPADKGE
jgi:hypothetical protein